MRIANFQQENNETHSFMVNNSNKLNKLMYFVIISQQKHIIEYSLHFLAPVPIFHFVILISALQKLLFLFANFHFLQLSDNSRFQGFPAEN